MEILGRVVSGMFGFGLTLLVVSSLWRIFTKAGRSGWLALIPVVNAITLLKVAGKPGWWVLLMPVPVLNLIVLLSMMSGLAKSFGRGFRFALGLSFLSPLFMPLLAFSDLRYRGPDGVRRAS